MQITFWKTLSLVIAGGYVVADIVSEGPLGVLHCLPVLIPLALIWFADGLGGFVGYYIGHGIVDQETPAILVAFMGWFLLIGMPVLIYVLNKQGGN